MAILRDPAISEMLLLCFSLVLFVGGLFGLAVGAGLLLFTSRTLALFQRLNRWISTRATLKPLERPRAGLAIVDKPAGRIAFGLLFTVGGAYAAYVLALRTDPNEVVYVASVTRDVSVLAAILVDTLRWVLVVGCLSGVVAGALLLARPQWWRRIESGANHWYSTRRMAAGGDVMHLTLDRLVEQFPRTAGGLVLALSAIPAVASAILIFGR